MTNEANLKKTKVVGKAENFVTGFLSSQTTKEVVNLAIPIINGHLKRKFGINQQILDAPKPNKTLQIETKAPSATAQVKVNEKLKEVKLKEVFHEKFDEIYNLVKLQFPAFLSGEAGTGKNVICKQVADALDLEFYFTNAVTQEFQLKGFTDANGTYHETQFYKAFKNGGLFFLDEIDASVPEALIILNSALSNGYFDFPAPIGKVYAHEDFRVIAAGNTYGTGADTEYSGRFQLDASSLDRFAIVKIGYSPKIEESITDNNDELCEFARAFREITKYASIKCLFSYRNLNRISALEKTLPLTDVLKMSLTKGLGRDDISVISGMFKKINFSNKYTKALDKLCNESVEENKYAKLLKKQMVKQQDRYYEDERY